MLCKASRYCSLGGATKRALNVESGMFSACPWELHITVNLPSLYLHKMRTMKGLESNGDTLQDEDQKALSGVWLFSMHGYNPGISADRQRRIRELPHAFYL